MPSPLAQGVLPPAPIVARVQPGPVPTSCITSFEDLAAWLRTFGVEFNLQQVAFAYSSGTAATATPEQRSFPRFLFTDTGAYMGIGIYDPSLGNWVIGGVIGELKTVVRSADTVVLDMQQKGFTGAGWKLADGTDAAIPNLTTNDGFFTGTGPNWDVYTVGYTGV